jgi:hypothetical protein
MFKFLILSLLSTSFIFSSVQAECPKLTGVYKCKEDTGLISIDQELDESKNMAYAITNILNGTLVTITNEIPEDLGESVFVTGSCPANNLNMKIEIMDRGIDYTLIFKLDKTKTKLTIDQSNFGNVSRFRTCTLAK